MTFPLDPITRPLLTELEMLFSRYLIAVRGCEKMLTAITAAHTTMPLIRLTAGEAFLFASVLSVFASGASSDPDDPSEADDAVLLTTGTINNAETSAERIIAPEDESEENPGR